MAKPIGLCGECRWCEKTPLPTKIHVPGRPDIPPRGANEPDGVCMFNPPAVFPLGGNQMATFRPGVRTKVDYCGHFRPETEN